MAEYPITDLIYNDEKKSNIKDDQTIKYWQNIFEKNINVLKVLKQSGMDYYSYGNSLLSISYPFKRMLICPRCKEKHSADAMNFKFKGFKFDAKCISKSCGYKGYMDAVDEPTKEVNKIKIVHWDLLHIDIKYNSITGDHFYYYTVPADLSGAIASGDLDIVKTTRLEVIEAVKRRKQLKLMSDNVYHLKRVAPQYIIPSQRGWGIPLVMPILKDMFHCKILKKGNEMIAFDHIVPLRMLFPQGTGDVSPHLMTNLGKWRTNIEQEVQAWRRDPNRISVVPMPLGVVNFSGDARLLMVTPEIRSTEDSIITGLGIIPEIIRGGASWSGSNVSLRIVENTFLNHRTDMQNVLDFIIEKISLFLNKPKISVKMADFKMADDIQKKQLMVNAAQGGSQALFSKATVLKEMNFDPEIEYKQKMEELKKSIEIATMEAEGNAEAQGAATVVNALYTADAQMENQKRMEMHDRKMTQDRQMAIEKEKEDTIEPTTQEAVSIAGGNQQISIPNLILILTNRFAKLAKVDMDEFKIRMLAMKNSTPNLYNEVYNNLKEMNLIVADTQPDIAEAQKSTPGQIPSFSQAEQSADMPSNPAEAGASLPSQVLPVSTGLKNPANPEVKPPKSPSPSI